MARIIPKTIPIKENILRRKPLLNPKYAGMIINIANITSTTFKLFLISQFPELFCHQFCLSILSYTAP